MPRDVLKAANLSVRLGGELVVQDLSFTMREGDQWAVTGPSGSGKTTLLKALAGKLLHNGSVETHGTVLFVEDQHHFRNRSNTTQFYYQQRFNSMDSEDALTVNEELTAAADVDPREVEAVVNLFELKPLLQESLIQLSNGENKRLQLAKALLLKPSVLLLDNPFTGLDAGAREKLEEVLARIAAHGVAILLVASPERLPRLITQVLVLDAHHEGKVVPAQDFHPAQVTATHKMDEALLSHLLDRTPGYDFEHAVKMEDVNITYDGRKILSHVSWQVRRGERWSLSGGNGAGKSTLLSLINADNPQAYANNMYLFDRKRGTGETIWEIKQKIGFVSPELHLHFDASGNCFEIVASGLFDTIGLFRMLTDEQVKTVQQWMKVLGITALARRSLHQLSNSEQRLLLLARALVKNPPVLILDEPCQGLDDGQVRFFRGLIDQLCERSDKTLLYVSHYPDEIPACVNKFLRLEKGRVRL